MHWSATGREHRALIAPIHRSSELDDRTRSAPSRERRTTVIGALWPSSKHRPANNFNETIRPSAEIQHKPIHYGP
ncbi:hypothetical protein DENSPDRAFT_841047 [Dentipellis sp. KUC8613]|nr:hypothetical protein DENSPDRAFT_841047 [Dentipellis sp. KUC8613]